MPDELTQEIHVAELTSDDATCARVVLLADHFVSLIRKLVREGGGDGGFFAQGQHVDPTRALAFPEGHQWIGAGIGHLDLLGRPDAYEVIRNWLAN